MGVPLSRSLTSTPRIRSSPLLVFLLILAAAFWLIQLLRSVCNLFSYWDIQVFYREALHISPVSWVDVIAWRGGLAGSRGQGAVGAAQTEGPTGKRAESSLTATLGPEECREVGYHHVHNTVPILVGLRGFRWLQKSRGGHPALQSRRNRGGAGKDRS